MLTTYSLSPLRSCGRAQRLADASLLVPVKAPVLIQRAACIPARRSPPQRVLLVSSQSGNTSGFADSRSISPVLLLYLSTFTCTPPPASAADSIIYTPGGGADVVRNAAGLAYVGLLAFWLFKVIGRRIKRGTTERLASEADPDAEEEPVEDDKEVTAGAAALGAIQAAFFTYLLFLFSTNISKFFGQQDLPDQYTARNITVTIRTAVGGLAYLATFIFGANALGLAGLTLKLAFFPDAVSDKSTSAAQQKKDDSRS